MTISSVDFARREWQGQSQGMRGNTGSWDLVVDCHNLEVVVAPMLLNKYSEGIILFFINKKETQEFIVHMLLLLLSHFSCVRLCEIPQMAIHQTPLSLGFSRQEDWSGLPFPSPMHACMLSRFSHIRLSATPWIAAHQAPLSTGFSRQEYGSGLPFPSTQFMYLRAK